MKKTEQVGGKNYLDRIPVRREGMNWTVEENGIVTLEIENKGVFNRIAQKLFKKPPVTYIHLDENGSFVWQLIDGKTDITAIGIPVKEHFGDAAEPLYERLAKFFSILESYRFVSFRTKE